MILIEIIACFGALSAADSTIDSTISKLEAVFLTTNRFDDKL